MYHVEPQPKNRRSKGIKLSQVLSHLFPGILPARTTAPCYCLLPAPPRCCLLLTTARSTSLLPAPPFGLCPEPYNNET